MVPPVPPSAPTPVPFVDLHLTDDLDDVRQAIERVVASGWFVLGPEVEAFEAEFAAASGAPYAVGVANGTDAISLLLRAADIGPGDEVLVPGLTAAFTALAVTMTGATPVFVDVDAERLTMDPARAAEAVTSRTRAIVPVHLYGRVADMTPLQSVAERHGLVLIEDCCQAHLARYEGQPVGTTGLGGAFSFYPTKNLGALGDGGAIVTASRTVADRIRRLRNGGQAVRNTHEEAGINSRLDELQAAILRARLPRLEEWTARRRALAAVYRTHLPAGVLGGARERAGDVHHLFPIRVPRRHVVQAHLAAQDIQTLVHYPVAMPDQPAFRSARGSCPVARRAAGDVLSLPLHPYLSDAAVMRVCSVVAGAVAVAGEPT